MFRVVAKVWWDLAVEDNDFGSFVEYGNAEKCVIALAGRENIISAKIVLLNRKMLEKGVNEDD